MLTVHQVDGRLVLNLNCFSLEFESSGDQTRVRLPDLGTQLDLDWNLKLLQTIVLPVIRQDSLNLSHQTWVIAYVFITVAVDVLHQ